MQDQDSAELRRRAHEAGLGVDWSRADDHAASDVLAWAAPAATLPGPALQRLSPKATVAAAAPAAAAGRQRQEAEAAAAPAASAPGPNLDAVAMAQTLQEAARNGTPFCEECERLRQQRAAAR